MTKKARLLLLPLIMALIWAISSQPTAAQSGSILLIDDNEHQPIPLPYYTDTLDNLGVSYDLWTIATDGEPTASDLSPYNTVIWTSVRSHSGPYPASELALADYLDNGGCFFVSNPEYHWAQGQTMFMSEYLGVESVHNDVHTMMVTGEPPLFEGIGTVTLDHRTTNWSDTITPNDLAQTVFTGDTGPSAIAKESPIYRTIYFGFPFEALPTADIRQTVLGTILDWCGSGASLGTLEGMVTDTDTGSPIADATITASDGTRTRSATTADDGSYSLFLGAGVYDVTAVASGYLSATTTSTIVTDTVTIADFTLTGSRLTVSPSSITEDMVIGDLVTNTLTLTNTGPVPIDFQVNVGNFNTSNDPSVVMLQPANTENKEKIERPQLQLESTPATSAPAPMRQNTPPFALVVDDGTAEQFFGLTGNYGYFPLNQFMVTEEQTPFTLTEIWGLFDNLTATSQDNLTLVVFYDQYEEPTSTTELLGWEAVPAPDADGTAWTIFELNEPVVVPDAGYVYIGVINQTPDTTPQQLQTGADTSNEGNSWLAYVSYASSFWQEPNFSTNVYLTSLEHYGIYANWTLRGYGIPGVFVSWVGVEPAGGTVPPNSSVTIDVIFDARNLTEVGTYNADLTFSGSFAGDTPAVPLTMNVSCPDCGILEGSITSSLSSAPVNAQISISSNNFSWENVSDDYNVAVAPDSYTIAVEADGYISQTATVTVDAGQTITTDFILDPISATGNILLVNDTEHAPGRIDPYLSTLDSLNVAYDVWSIVNDGMPTASDLLLYETILWASINSAPTAQAEMALATSLDAGRCVVISAPEYHPRRGITSFMSNYLGVNAVQDYVNPATITGVTSPFAGLGPYSIGGHIFGSEFYPDSTAEVAFQGNDNLTVGIFKQTAVYNSTLWGFPFDGLADEADRLELLSVTLNWCGQDTSLGALAGTVTDVDTGDPLANATVTATGGVAPRQTTTDADGQYQLSLGVGEYEVTAVATNYVESMATVSIISDTLTSQDFVLDGSRLSYSPASIEESLLLGQIVTNTVTITNDGPLPIDYSINIGSFENPSLSRPVNMAPVPVEVKPVAESPITAITPDLPLQRSTAIPLNTPPLELAVDDGSWEQVLGISQGANLVWFNRFTPDSNSFPLTLTEAWLLFTDSNGFANVGDELTLIIYEDADGNPMSGADHLASYTIDIQAVDGTTWSVYELDEPLVFNEPTDILIGAINQAPNNNSIEYVATFDQTSSQGRSWVGVLEQYNEAPILGTEVHIAPIEHYGLYGNWLVRGYGQEGIFSAWATATPRTGTIAPFSTATFEVTFDASQVQELGQYTADLRFSGSFVNEVPTMPLTMNVSCDECAVISGTVTDAGTNLPLVADVTVTGDNGFSYSTNGSSFAIPVPAGSYTITANADGYVPESVAVTVSANETVVVDIALEAETAVLSYTPPVFRTTVPLSGVVTDTFTLFNTGNSPLTFDTSIIYADNFANSGTSTDEYKVTDSNDPNGPLYNFIDISQTGNPLLMGDDEWMSAVFGFSFPFYGETHEFGFVSTNGFIDFSNQIGGLGFNNSCPLDPASNIYPNEIIALMWDDLRTGDGGIFEQSFSDCPYGSGGACWILQYDNVEHFGMGSAGTFQAILFEDGDILMQYEDVGDEAGAGSTTGLASITANQSDNYGACNTQDHLEDELAICYSYGDTSSCGRPDQEGWLTLSPATGTIPAGGSMVITGMFDATVVTQTRSYEAEINFSGNFAPVDPLNTRMNVFNCAPNCGTLNGSILDETGQPLMGTIMLDGPDGFEMTVTGSDYELIVPAGEYEMIVMAVDYAVQRMTFSLETDQTMQQATQLELGVYDAEITLDQTQMAESGDIVEYTFTVQNTGSTANMFTVHGSGEWPMHISSHHSGLMMPDEEMHLIVTVHVPEDAPVGSTDTVTLTFVSDMQEEMQMQVHATTQVMAEVYTIYLPFISR